MINKKKTVEIALIVFWLPLLFSSLALSNSRYDELKSEVFSDPYSQRPTYNVTRKPFGKPGNKPENHLRTAARRTLKSAQDLYDFENGQKLLQANGICFAGQWVMDQPSRYSGLFSYGTISPAIVRASVALSGVQRKDKRAFGMAVKLLPDSLGDAASLNLFVLNSMGGVVTDHTLSLVMDNQPPLGRIPRFSDIRTVLRMKKDLEAADREHLSEYASSDAQKIKPNATFRPVTHLAGFQSGDEPNTVISPQWIRFTAITTERVDKDDFRDELSLNHYEKGRIEYQIDVAADHGGKKSSARWDAVGRLILTESIVSRTCDSRLHFQHPSLSQ